MPFQLQSLIGAALAAAAQAAAVPSSGDCAWFSMKASSSSGTQMIRDIFQTYNLPENNQGATAFALIYGSSLNLYTGNHTFPSNHLTYNNGTDTSSSGAPAPNAVTVYSHAFLDLADTNLVLTIPPYEPDRFYSFEFFDPFQSSYASVGVVNNNPAGNYLVRPSLLNNNAGETRADCPNQYAGCINAPTLDSVFLGRVELKSKADEAYVNQYLRQIKLTPAARTGGNPSGLGPLQPSSFQNLPTSKPLQTLKLTSTLASRNPPWLPSLAQEIPGLLQCAGINTTAQTYTPVPNVNVTAAWNTRSTVLNQYLHGPNSHQLLTSGWATPNGTVIGGFVNSSDIVARSFWQTIGNLWNVAHVAIYAAPSTGDSTIPANKSIILDFVDGKPPVADDGFWSLSAYNAGGGLVANSYGIEQVGSIGNITYPDGQLVYGPKNTKLASTPFQVLLQSADIPPPANWTGNWLPVPTDGEFQLPMRFYAPQPASTDGSYTWPVIGAPIDAIRG